jgi:hypothetical protein
MLLHRSLAYSLIDKTFNILRYGDADDDDDDEKMAPKYEIGILSLHI